MRKDFIPVEDFSKQNKVPLEILLKKIKRGKIPFEKSGGNYYINKFNIITKK